MEKTFGPQCCTWLSLKLSVLMYFIRPAEPRGNASWISSGPIAKTSRFLLMQWCLEMSSARVLPLNVSPPSELLCKIFLLRYTERCSRHRAAARPPTLQLCVSLFSLLFTSGFPLQVPLIFISLDLILLHPPTGIWGHFVEGTVRLAMSRVRLFFVVVKV